MWPWSRSAKTELPNGKVPNVKEEGIVVLHDDGPDALVDICFVHGLGGHRTRTWSKEEYCWPQQLLPTTLSSRNIKTRILSFGYDASPAKWTGGSSHGRVWGFARSLMHELVDYREDLGGELCDRPIIFVGHSLGGLVIKSAISQSQQRSPGKPERNVFDLTRGLVFLGTPHHGSDLATWARYVKGIFAIAQRNPNMNLIEVLTPDAAQLKDLSEGFDNVSGQIPKYCCYETESTCVAGIDIGLIVSETSAIMNGAELEAISEDHVNMCKFDSEHDPNYKGVTRGIRRLATQIANSKRREVQVGESGFQRLRDELISSLHAPELFAQDYRIYDAESKTFEWLMDSPQKQHSNFVDFLRGSHTLFWISGKAGSGKSTLMKFLFEHPKLRKHLEIGSGGEAYLTLSFSFHKIGHYLQRSLEGLLRSLLCQLIEHIPEDCPIYQRQASPTIPWTVMRLRSALSDCINAVPRVFICLDGLDEYAPSTGKTSADDREEHRLEIARFICEFAAMHSQLKLCVSGRPYDEFQRAFRRAPSLLLHELTKHDIWTYINNRFSLIEDHYWQATIVSEEDSNACRKFWGRLSPREVLRDEVARRSSGIFLWVRLVVKRLEKQIRRARASLTEMIQSLARCSGELEQLFDDMWNEILPEDRKDGLIYIQLLQKKSPFSSSFNLEFIACGTNPSIECRGSRDQEFQETFGELNVGRMKDRTKIRLEACCGQFIEIDGDHVHVIHQSVVDYLLSGQFKWANIANSGDIKEMADVCAAASITVQLWNPKDLKCPSIFNSEMQFWVFEAIRLGISFIDEVLRSTHLDEGNTNLYEQLLKAASSPRLLFWAFGVSGRNYKDRNGFYKNPRGELFANFCLVHLWRSRRNVFYECKWPKQQITVEMLFELTLVVQNGYTEIEEMWSHCKLQSQSGLRKETLEEHSTWQYCLIMLTFFYLVHLRPFYNEPHAYLSRSPRCPRSSAKILHNLVVDLIKDDVDPCASIDIYPIFSGSWKCSQPVWALSCYSEHNADVRRRIDEDLQMSRQLSALDIIEMVFGNCSEAWTLLRKKRAPLETSNATFSREILLNEVNGGGLGQLVRNHRRNAGSTYSTAFNSTNVGLSDGCIGGSRNSRPITSAQRRLRVTEWYSGSPSSIPMAPYYDVYPFHGDESGGLDSSPDGARQSPPVNHDEQDGRSEQQQGRPIRGKRAAGVNFQPDSPNNTIAIPSNTPGGAAETAVQFYLEGFSKKFSTGPIIAAPAQPRPSRIYPSPPWMRGENVGLFPP
ncbi:hypothetical protein HDK90DRAFT_461027 [Phyllosticta capitalensis]|uniref:Nephrocystin 3-like N-terminal domain-containing protein n=1 Tax=Phyllosticta capitalensis TaxID=121624 RepID=A0ABR1Z197_9PEZI